jgi:hypothetical protein
MVRPLAELTRALRVAILVEIGVLVLTFVRALLWFLHYVAIVRGSRSFEFLHTVSGVMLVVLRLQTPVALLALVLFLVWLARANGNLRALSGEQMEFTPGWAVGWFFVPFANFVMPYRVVKEIWQVSRRQEEDRSTFLVGWWWCLSVAGYALTVVMSIVGMSLVTRPSVLFPYLTLAVAVHAVSVTTAVLRLGLVGRIGSGYSHSIVEPIGTASDAGTGVAGYAGSPGLAPAGWYADPCGRHEHRFWDGVCWSPAVADQGVRSHDPV